MRTAHAHASTLNLVSNAAACWLAKNGAAQQCWCNTPPLQHGIGSIPSSNKEPEMRKRMAWVTKLNNCNIPSCSSTRSRCSNRQSRRGMHQEHPSIQMHMSAQQDCCLRTAPHPPLERGRTDTTGGGADGGQLSLRIDSRRPDDSTTGVQPSLLPLYPGTQSASISAHPALSRVAVGFLLEQSNTASLLTDRVHLIPRSTARPEPPSSPAEHRRVPPGRGPRAPRSYGIVPPRRQLRAPTDLPPLQNLRVMAPSPPMETAFFLSFATAALGLILSTFS